MSSSIRFAKLLCISELLIFTTQLFVVLFDTSRCCCTQQVAHSHVKDGLCTHPNRVATDTLAVSHSSFAHWLVASLPRWCLIVLLPCCLCHAALLLCRLAGHSMFRNPTWLTSRHNNYHHHNQYDGEWTWSSLKHWNTVETFPPCLSTFQIARTVITHSFFTENTSFS
jgi:hypothetical protein